MRTPHRTSILYAEPHDESGRLLPFCKQARDAFAEMGLVVDERRALKLHATILNTVYAKDDKEPKPEAMDDGAAVGQRAEQDFGEGAEQEAGTARRRSTGGKNDHRRRGRRRKPMLFDGQELIEWWKDKEWAEVQVEKLAICEMGAKENEIGEVRYMEVEASELPGVSI